jgi:spoIIIJ-associated protein
LLTKMGITATVVPRAETPIEAEGMVAAVSFDIEDDDLGILIGRRGQTLACLQYIVRLIIFNQTKVWVPVTIDVEGYRQRRAEALQALASRIADQVRANGVPFTLEPMPAYERRVVHLTLADHPDVVTQSIGEGEARKVVISPK